MYDYIVIGAGITGLTAGIMLKKNNVNFVVLEKDNQYGGLCKTKLIQDHYFDIGGAHILHSNKPKALDFLFSFLPIDHFSYQNAKIKIHLKNAIIDFPIELNLWQLPEDEQIEYVLSIIKTKEHCNIDNFEGWIEAYLGERIAQDFMIPYNKKLWGNDLTKLSVGWVNKLPQTDKKMILRTIINKKNNFSKNVVSHQQFYYPKFGGFQTIVDNLAQTIISKILLNQHIEELSYVNNYWELRVNGEILKTKNIINTAPWQSLNIKLYKDTTKLEYIGNVVSLIERDYDHDYHWIYIPDEKILHHREFYIKNICSYSKSNGIMTDINYKRWCENRANWQKQDIIAEYINQYAYPIPTIEGQESIDNMLKYYKSYNLFGLGRWGQWKYLNVDMCVDEVLKFFESKEG